jgi:hypothetical protein
MLVLITACTSSKRTQEKIKHNGHCSECEIYIVEKLIPQLESCDYDMDSREDCKFNKEEFEKHASCFLGMKKEVLENLIGADYGYSVKERANSSTLLWFKYNRFNENTRLIEILNLNASRILDSNVACLDCDKVYANIRVGHRLKKMRFEEFHERYKGCFYGKQTAFLIENLGLKDRIEEGEDYNYSYNKKVQLGKDIYTINFLFYPGERLIDLRLID